MTEKGKLAHKLHQLQKRVNRAFKKNKDDMSLKTILRINRIKKIKESLSKSLLLKK